MAHETPSSRTSLGTRLFGARTRPAVVLLVILGLALPALPYLLHLGSFGSMPSNDYYITIEQLRDGDRWSTDLYDWWRVRSNEHRCILPALVYRMNAALFNGDNRGHGAWALLMMACTGLALATLLPSEWRRRPWAVAPAAFLIGAFAFAPLAVHNVALGFSGVMWLTSNALVTGALALLHLRPRSDRGLALAIALGAGAHFSYSSGLMVWPTLLLLAILQRQDRRRILILLLVAVLLLGYSVLSYKKVPQHPELNQGQDLKLLLRYTSVYLGSPFLFLENAADTIGNLSLAALVLSLLLVPPAFDAARRRRLLAPWWAVGFYALANIVGTGVGRSGWGAAQALASRYGTISGLFWICLLMPPLLLSFESLRRPVRPLRRWWTAGVWLLFLVMLTHPLRERGGDLLKSFTHRASFHPVATWAITHDVPDFVIMNKLSPRPDQIWRLRSFLRAQGHVPFDRPVEPWPSGQVDVGSAVHSQGALQGADAVPGGWVRLSGWTQSETREIEHMVLGDAEGRVLGPVIYGSSRADLVKHMGEEVRYTGFFAYVRSADVTEPPTVWIRFRGSDAYVRLHTLGSFPGRWAESRAESLTLPAP